MSEFNHTHARELIFSGQPLSVEQQQQLQAHLAGCPQCRETAELHEVLQHNLPQAYPAPAQTRAKEQTRLAAVQSALGRHRMIKQIVTPVRWAFGALAVVAALALLSWAVRTLAPMPAAPERTTPTSPSVLPGIAPYPPPTATTCAFNPSFTGRYLVQPGDTIFGVAQTFGIYTNSLVRGNCLSSLEIFVDQVLRVPGPTATPPPYPAPTSASQPTLSARICAPDPSYNGRYIVQSGDTLYSIGRRFGISAATLQRANCLSSTNIRVGQVLRVPDARDQGLQPVAGGKQITIAGWSPDSRWLAFWLAPEGSTETAVYPWYPAELQLYDRQSGSICSIPDLIAPDNTPVYWTDDGHLALSIESGASGGLPCQPLAPMTDEQFQIIAAQAAPDDRLSPGGRYRAETTQTADNEGILDLQTIILDTSDDTVAAIINWQRYSALGELGLGGEWLTDEVLLITTDFQRGPLLVDLRGTPRIIEVAEELFDVPGVVNPDPQNYTGLVAYGAPHPEIPGEFHLLLAGTGSESQFPPVRLYHSENGSVEALPYSHFGGFLAEGAWLLLEERDTSSGFEVTNYWSQAVDGGPNSLTFQATDGHLYFAPNAGQFILSGRDRLLERRSFPGNELLASWELSPYQPGQIVWSPDSEIAAVVGYADPDESQRWGLFLLPP